MQGASDHSAYTGRGGRMTEQHRAEHVESAGDYYARTQNVHQIFAAA